MLVELGVVEGPEVAEADVGEGPLGVAVVDPGVAGDDGHVLGVDDLAGGVVLAAALVLGRGAQEGGDEAGLEKREAVGAPGTAKERMKWALKPYAKDNWVYEYGQTYCFDFFNPYLDFNDFALRLPGFTLPIMKYWDGQPLR